MIGNSDAVLYAALCIGILLLVEGGYQLIAYLRTGPRAQINRRMQMLAGGDDPLQVLATLRRDSRGSGGKLARRLPAVGALERLLVQAGLSIPIGRVFVGMGALGGVSLVLAQLLLRLPPLPAVVAAAVVGVGLPVLWLRMRKGKRLQQMEAQLPDAIDLMIRSLRVGHPLSAALGVVAREMPDPLGSEFGIVADEVTYGQELPDALHRMTERVGLEDLRYLAVVITMQHESGGNLAEALEALVRVIRARFQLFRKVRSITADGRMSAWFLSLFPIVMVFGLRAVKPDYYSQVADHPLFAVGVVATVVLLVVNIVFMRLITQIKV